MKIPGVTFSAAASPIPTPRQRDSSGREKSQSTRQRRSRLICPKLLLAMTGSHHSATAASSGTATPRSTRAVTLRMDRYDAASRSARLTTRDKRPTAASGTSRSGVNAAAANGG